MESAFIWLWYVRTTRNRQSGKGGRVSTPVKAGVARARETAPKRPKTRAANLGGLRNSPLDPLQAEAADARARAGEVAAWKIPQKPPPRRPIARKHDPTAAAAVGMTQAENFQKKTGGKGSTQRGHVC